MEFWGVQVKSGKPLKVESESDKLLHLSHATIGESKKSKPNESISLSLKIDDQKLVLGTLSPGNTPQLNFDLVFEKDFELSHNWKNGSVFFMGYKSIIPEDDETDNEPESEDDIPLQLENGSLETKVDSVKPSTVKSDKKPESSEKPKAKVEQPQEEEKPKEDDGEDRDDDDDDDDDDEISTGHSPIGTEDSHEKQEQVGVMTEEVATSDVPAKRLKLLNGGYGKSLVLDHANSVKPGESYDYDDDAESSYTKGRTQGVEIASILGRKRPRDDKIRNTLEILENLIPGGKGKDPLVILDEAIKYLISLKLKAKSQGAFPL